jgi:choline dehydrogenase-like flavoprotein
VIYQLGTPSDGFSPAAQSWDLCIVGAGAAGLALAAQFLGTPWRVIVLESGAREPDETDADLNTLACVGLRHDGWRDGRVRCLGGTTRAWGGQLVPMRRSELQARPWVPESGWPLNLEELEPYYRRVEQLLRTEGPPYDEHNLERLRIPPPQFDAAQFQLRFSQWTALGRRNFALLWRRELAKSPNVSVLLDATAIAVQCTPTGDHCNCIRVRSRSRLGTEEGIRAGAFVIACGGLETARLLLASALPNGGSVANSSGLVGRYFQDHISYVAGRLRPVTRRKVQNIFDPRYLGGTMFSMKVEPTDAAMQRNGWLNAMAHIAFQIPDALGWMEVRRVMRSLQAGRVEIPSRDEMLALLRGGTDLLRLVVTRAIAHRRRSPDSGGILLLVDCEQAPNSQSRVWLDDTRDALGVRRLCLDWQITDLEYRTLPEFACQAARELERVGLATVELASDPDFERRDSLGAARDIYHHMGTTRMSRSPASGVTTPSLRCHDVDNLYVAGPSVFPTSGIANPTFTVLALTLRLADQLKAARRREDYAQLAGSAA